MTMREEKKYKKKTNKQTKEIRCYIIIQITGFKTKFFKAIFFFFKTTDFSGLSLLIWKENGGKNEEKYMDMSLM